MVKLLLRFYDPSDGAITVDGAPVTMEHDVFAYSGTGSVDATVVYVGKGRPQDYDGIDATDKVVLLKRDEIFHRSQHVLKEARR